MSTIVPFVRITLTDKDDQVTENTDIGLYNVVSDNSEFRWIMNSVAGLSTTFKDGMLVKNGISRISRRADLRRGGNIGSIGGCNVAIKNTSQFWNSVNSADITLQGKKVEVGFYEGTTENVIWIGVCETVNWDAKKYSINCVPSIYKRKSNITYETNVVGTSDKVSVPVTFGEWTDTQAKLVQTEKTEEVWDAAQVASYVAGAAGSIDVEPEDLKSFPVVDYSASPSPDEKRLYVLYGQPDILTLATKNPDDLYVKVLKNPNESSAEGSYRKINEITGRFESSQRMFEIELDEYLPVELDADNDGNGAWIQIVQIDKAYSIESWSCEGFLDDTGISATISPVVYSYDKDSTATVSGSAETVFIDETEEGYIELPKVVDVTEGDTDYASITIRPSLFNSSVNKVSSFLFLKPSTNRIELYDEDNLTGFTILGNDGINCVKQEAGIYSAIDSGGTPLFAFRFHTTVAVDGWQDYLVNQSRFGDTNPLKISSEDTGTSINRGIIYVVKFRLPRVEENFKFKKAYILLSCDMEKDTVGGTSRDSFIKLAYKRFIGSEVTIFNEDDCRDIGTGNTRNLTSCFPNFYCSDITDDNYNFYVQKNDGGRDLRGYVNFEMDVDNADDYNSYLDGYIINYGAAQDSGTYGFNATYYELAIMFEREISIKKNLYTFYSGRKYNDTWDGRKTSANVITSPIDVFEHVCRLQNWSDFTENVPAAGWGRDYSDGAQIKTSGTGSFDSNTLASIADLQCARQILNSKDAWTDALKKSLCVDFFLLNYVDKDGKENLIRVKKSPLETPSNIITYGDIRAAGSVIKVNEPNPSDVYVEPFVKYNLNSGDNKYQSTIAVHNVSASSFDQDDPDNAGWIEAPAGVLSGTEAEELWTNCRTLYLKTGIINDPPNELTQLKWANGDDDNADAIAKYHLQTWVEWMWQRTIEFEVHFNHVSNEIYTRDLYEGSRFMLQLPHQTNNSQIECMITSLTFNLNPPYNINISAILLNSGDIIDSGYIQEVMFTDAEGADYDWAETTTEYGDSNDKTEIS